MLRRAAKRSRDAGLDDVLQLDHAEQPAIGGDRQRRGAGAADAGDGFGEGGVAAGVPSAFSTESTAPLR